jgi:SulP family sulfate permease
MKKFVFNRMELAGSLGDLGTLLPIAMAMVLFNGLNPLGLFFSIGLFYILSGVYFGITVPIQPMKVIGAYAIATAMSAEQILASSLIMALFLLIIGLTGAIDLIRKITPNAVIRGVQLSTGALLISGGIKFMIGTSTYQVLQKAVEPHLAWQALGPLPISLIIGAFAAIITLFLLDNTKIPAGLVVVVGGLATGLLLGARMDFADQGVGFYLPEILPFGFPAQADFTFALFALVLPQLPMTLGNAVLAYTDLSRDYFGEASARLTNKKACVSMALANLLSFSLGGMPLCHGAGGLAAHYRFGARSAGSNLMIGFVFAGLALFLGNNITGLFNLLPMSVLGVLLIFAGSQLTLTIMELKTRKDYFVATLILGINLAAGFIAGMVVAQVLKWKKLSV